MSFRPAIIRVYKRIRKAYEEGRGVRLSPDEVASVWLGDDAVSQAVMTAEEQEALTERRRELASVLGRSPSGDPCDCIEPCLSGRPHDEGTYCRRTGSDRVLTERRKS